MCLLRNDRDEWELPGGQLEEGEQPEQCLAREIREELSLDVEVEEPVATWLFEVIPGKQVLIAAYRCGERNQEVIPRLSNEHRGVGWFKASELESIQLPNGYARAVRLAAMQRIGVTTRSPSEE